ncbi:MULTISPECIES: S16 family serine protease [Microbacterium]|uniref:S16 family serine protease n=1 Tax=Microbacterium TaxID=33882 RepID=UPI001D16FD6E|nr:S16 family serine protease [Microbacterium testaceum]MCC4247386.1 hypothetical protein [Microbacterium testaceum]
MRRTAAAAVALVCALVLSGCGLKFSLGFGTGEDGRFDGTELTVPVLYASGKKGVLATQRITAASAEGAGLSIDITENDVSGVDPVTQSATWTAVTAATLLTGARPDTAYTFGFDTRLATPAAGAVTAVGVLALYYGSEIQPGVALSGAVTPFGAIRPVAGLAEQVTAAVEAGGIDTILVPAGQRLVRDARGETVDLDQLAATGGMTVTEVADIASAYAVMTGEDLPESAFPTPPASPSPLPTSDDADVPDEALGGAVDELAAAVADALAAASDAALAEPARAALARAEALRAEGEVAAAFSAAVDASDRAALAVAPETSIGEASGAAARTAEDASALLADLDERSPGTLDDVDRLLRAATAAADAYALARYADDLLTDPADDAARAVATTAAMLAASSLQTAQTVAALPPGGGGPLSGDADLDGLASLLRRAAVAASDAYRTRVVAARADADGVPVDAAAIRLAAADPAALRALALDHARAELVGRAPDDRGWAALGIALAGYTRVSPVLAATQTVRPPVEADAEDAASRRIAVGDEYTVSAVDALAAAGAGVPFARGLLAEAVSAAEAEPSAGATRFVTPFVTARVLAFVAGVERS